MAHAPVPPDTSAAIATPPGVGGVGILRISGPRAADLATALAGGLPGPGQFQLKTFRDAAGEPIDTGLLLWFPGPASYTGEDVIELQAHGSPILMDLLLERCLELGARLARPGEFTERAFLNGKLDLIQAEAVADLIEGSTRLGVRLANRSLEGVFSRRIRELLDALLRVRVQLEATFDFPDDDIDLSHAPETLAALTTLIDQTSNILAAARQGQLIREGLAVVIAGPPNAGKSSLLNALAQTDAAIVTDIAGTTRDLLKLDIQIEGLPLRLVDTAGLRPSQDPVEREGIRRAEAQLQSADLVLWIYDSGSGPDHATRTRLPAGVPLIRVANKIDLLAQAPALSDTGDGPEVALSVLTGAGMDLLRAQIRSHGSLDSDAGGAFVARRRHVDALHRVLRHLRHGQSGLTSGSGAELVAEDLMQAQRALGEITGEVSSEDLLGEIFSSFCIGK